MSKRSQERGTQVHSHPSATRASGERAKKKSKEPEFVFLFIFIYKIFPSISPLPSFLTSSPSFALLSPSAWQGQLNAHGEQGWSRRLQSFHLMLYLAKTGCRVPWLSEGTHQRGGETRGEVVI